VVAIVAPGGEEDAARFVTHGCADGFGLVCQRVVEAAGEALPGARTRRDEIRAAEFAEDDAEEELQGGMGEKLMGSEEIGGEEEARARRGPLFTDENLPMGG
jgi:hypothetical protein